MSFLAPLWMGAAALAVMGVIALHLITTQRPPAAPLPTARFVPQQDARASSRAARPTDLLLLALRCAALLLLGAGFAGPVSRTRGSSLARVVLVDRSRGALADVRDSSTAVVRPGDALVLFDSAAEFVASGAADSLRTPGAGRGRGSLSAALVGASRAARDLARRADSIELVIVSPLTADELDAASMSLFARWPGRARLVRTAAARPVSAAVQLAGADADDALRPIIAALNAGAARGAAPVPVRVVRTAPLAADSAAARGGAAVVSWPRIGSATPSAQGLWAGNATLVAPLARLPLAAGGRVIARWSDGAPAAMESMLGGGCLRQVGVGVPNAGDVSLQPAFAAVARTLLGPCAGAGFAAPVADSVARQFARAGAAAAAAAFRAPDDRSPLAPWLLAAALLVLAGELFARRGAPEAAS